MAVGSTEVEDDVRRGGVQSKTTGQWRGRRSAALSTRWSGPRVAAVAMARHRGSGRRGVEPPLQIGGGGAGAAHGREEKEGR